jgi:hypothetical protein
VEFPNTLTGTNNKIHYIRVHAIVRLLKLTLIYLKAIKRQLNSIDLFGLINQSQIASPANIFDDFPDRPFHFGTLGFSTAKDIEQIILKGRIICS